MFDICPVTGLKVFKDSKWQNLLFGENYYVSFYMIGDYVLFVENYGDISTLNLKKLLERREAFIDYYCRIKNINPQTHRVVEIRDLKNISGSLTRKSKSEFKNFLFASYNRLDGYIVYNTPKFIKLIFKLGTKVTKPPVPVVISRNYKEAVKRGLELINSSESQKIYTRKSDPEWCYKSDDFEFINEIIDKDIFVSRGIGILEKKDLENVKSTISALFDSGQLNKDKYYKISDYTDVEGSSLGGRSGYARILKELYEKNSSFPKVTVICGAGRLLQIIVRLMGRFTGARLVYKDNFDEALSYIYELKNNEEILEKEEEVINIKRSDIEKLLQMLGEISWEILDENIENQELFEKDHPLIDVVDAINIIRDDVKYLMNNEKSYIQDIKTKNKDLKKEIEIREKTRQELQLAKLEAEDANRSKTEFLANMSHEIRTPMNGVIGMTEILLSTDLNEDQKIYAKTVQKSGESLLAIINDILDFSKIEAGRLDIENIEFDLRNAVEDTIETMYFKAYSKNIELILVIDPNVPSLLKGDPGRLRQIIVNLVNNAVKFTDQGEVVLKVSIETETVNDVTLIFKVKDTGIGIPKDKQDKLFESFIQADSSITRKYGGTGLGLSICRLLTGLMGGNIGLESQPGQGSEFYFTVKFEKQNKTIKTKTEFLPELVGKKVLITDDNSTNRLLFDVLLKSWGCITKEASTADAAIKILSDAAKENDPFDIAIIDKQMPGTSGNVLGKHIKEDGIIKNTILIMVTSLGEKGDSKDIRGIGFAGYLTKPVRQNHLYQCMRMALGYIEDDTKEDQLITRHTIKLCEKQDFKILFAEDHPVNQKVAKTAVERLGYGLDMVSDGKKAIELLKEKKFDLIFMDCQMPVMDGYKATEQIRKGNAGDKNKDVVIVAMTANAMKGDREKCISFGMNDYLAKPVTPDQIGGVIEFWRKKLYSQKSLS